MATRNPPWTRDELILALDLYFRQHPAHISNSHPDVVSLSHLLNQLPIHAGRSDPERFRNPNSVYMKLCNFLRLDPSYSGRGLVSGSKRDAEVWAEFAHDRSRLETVAAAIRALVEEQAAAAEELLEEDGYEAPEGRVLLREHLVRERRPELVRHKKQLVFRREGRLACEVCGFDFRHRYGQVGEGFIECHHTVPVSRLRPGEQTRIQDLSLVCANCHRMLHRGGELLGLADLRRMIAASERARGSP